MSRLPAIYQIVHANLKQASAKQAKYYNKNRRQVNFEVDDIVCRRNRVLSAGTDNFAAKLAPKFVAPCKIIKKVSPVVYELQDVGSNKKPTRVHVSDMKPYYPPETNSSTPTGSGSQAENVIDGQRQRPRDMADNSTSRSPPPGMRSPSRRRKSSRRYRLPQDGRNSGDGAHSA